ncbi:radical SAM protein [Candidatus Woesearchaeota archaeon]|nr:radical SAM protein [Candidatus Woesearchaeota archaeon]
MKGNKISTKRTIKYSTSVCPVCLKTVKARIIEDKDIVLVKSCEEHGDFRFVLSSDPEFYKSLYGSFSRLVKASKRKINQYYMFLTMRCNMRCPICYVDAGNKPIEDPSTEHVIQSANKLKDKHVSLMGGEPTMREDIHKIVRALRKNDNVVSVYTNGLKISDIEYLKGLITSGVNDIRLQFDGFNDETYKILRGMKLVEAKKKILSNLAMLNVPTVLEHVVARDLNEKGMLDTLEYAAGHKNIKGIGFNSYRNYGRASLGHERSVQNNEMVSFLAKHTSKNLPALATIRDDVLAFNKILYFLNNIGLIPIRSCFNHIYFALFRKNNRLDGLSSYINVGKIIKLIDNYQVSGKGKLSIMLELSGLLKHALSPEILKLMLLGRINEANLNDILIAQFVSPCDKYTYVGESAKYCFGQEIHPGEKGKEISQASGIKNIERESNH